MPLLIAALLGISGLLIVLFPLLGVDGAAATATSRDTLDDAERERLAKQALRDVEFDYRLGNLEAADYQDLRERYEQRALLALRARYERERALDAVIDEQLAALRGKKRGALANCRTSSPDAGGKAPRDTAYVAPDKPTSEQNGHNGHHGHDGRGPGGGGSARPRRRKGV